MSENRIDYETGEILSPPPVDPKAQAALFAKLARIMGKLGRLPKSGYNDHFKYEFVTDGDVSDAVRAALASENVAFFASMLRACADNKKTVVDFLYTFADGETGATWSCHWTGEAIDSQDKGTAKAATSALKYFLMKNFVLSSGDPADDSDSNVTQPKAQKAPAKKVKASSGNGNEPPKLRANGDVPTSPNDLLAYVDAKINGSYSNLPDLMLAIQAELGAGWKWPAASNVDGWAEARDAAIKHAEAA